MFFSYPHRTEMPRKISQQRQVVALGSSKIILQRMLHIQDFEATLSDICIISGHLPPPKKKIKGTVV